MSAELEGLHHKLNSPDLVDAQWYRRNHGAYELVSYVNHLIGLCVSGNFDLLPTFIDRVSHSLANEGDRYVSEAYLTLVKHYVQLLEKHLRLVASGKCLN